MSRKEPVNEQHSQALVVTAPWADLLINGKKKWEIRGGPTYKRGWYRLAQSRTGKLLGKVQIVDCLKIKKSDFAKHYKKHLVKDYRAIGKYKNIYAWVIRDAMKYACKKSYDHPSGCVNWVPV